ncbi:hypothetical protein Tco_1227028 [Tanacetum coccineum]
MTSTHQQSLADAGSETCPPMLEKETKDDLTGDDLKQLEVDIKATNLILLSIPNDIYSFVDACENEKDIWDRVKRLIQCTELTQTERELQFINEFDKFTSKPGESLTSVFSRIVNASRAKRVAKTHDPLALVANIYASSSSSRSPGTYYVTHPPIVVNYDDVYQGDVICDDQEDSLTIAMMLLSRAIT